MQITSPVGVPARLTSRSLALSQRWGYPPSGVGYSNFLTEPRVRICRIPLSFPFFPVQAASHGDSRMLVCVLLSQLSLIRTRLQPTEQMYLMRLFVPTLVLKQSALCAKLKREKGDMTYLP